MDKLKTWRKQIDKIDADILNLLAKRMNIVSKIGQFKKEQGKSFQDSKRWEQILKNSLSKGEKLKLSKDFIKSFLQLVHKHSLKIQKNS